MIIAIEGSYNATEDSVIKWGRAGHVTVMLASELKVMQKLLLSLFVE